MNENSINSRANVYENEVPAFRRSGMAIDLCKYCLSAMARRSPLIHSYRHFDSMS